MLFEFSSVLVQLTIQSSYCAHVGLNQKKKGGGQHTCHGGEEKTFSQNQPTVSTTLLPAAITLLSVSFEVFSTHQKCSLQVNNSATH